jgi:16S rRNA (cytosine1402-N4)-methyltransferase
MLPEVLEILEPRAGELAVDCTVGLAGHAAAVLKRIGPHGRLIGLDWDHETLAQARDTLAGTGLPFSLHASNFAGLPNILAREQVDGVDLLIADLGMSSVQVDDPNRGFSYVRDGPLDMRMDRSRGHPAGVVLAAIGEGELVAALRSFADEAHADRIARALVVAREKEPITTTLQLARVVGEAMRLPVTRDSGWRLRPGSHEWRSHPAARTFQALRMLVNRELANLQELLRVMAQCLRPGARAAIIAFHSGEDRMVKIAFRDGLKSGIFDQISAEPVRASQQERILNPRSRSAKLRWARRS